VKASCFGALGVLLGGSVRAEIVLVLANLTWFVLLLGGGIAVSASSLPGGLSHLAMVLPAGALAQGPHTALISGNPSGWEPTLVLLAWAALAGTLASRTTKATRSRRYSSRAPRGTKDRTTWSARSARLRIGRHRCAGRRHTLPPYAAFSKCCSVQ
jgi:hypothetical protein